jgi:hypothetical protein
MFGFIRKAKEGWERKVNETRTPVVEQLNNLLAHVCVQMAVSSGFTEGDDNHGALLEAQGKMVQGFEVFRMGADPRELSDTKPLIKCAAAMAQVACNDAILKGKIDQQKFAADMHNLLITELRRSS